MNAKFYRVLNRLIEAMETWTFLIVFVVLSLFAAFVMVYFAIKLYPTFWICAGAFLLQAMNAIRQLSPLIVARRMEKSK